VRSSAVMAVGANGTLLHAACAYSAVVPKHAGAWSFYPITRSRLPSAQAKANGQAENTRVEEHLREQVSCFVPTGDDGNSPRSVHAPMAQYAARQPHRRSAPSHQV